MTSTSKELYPYQREGVKFLKRTPNALLADAPGLGKTAQAVLAAAKGDKVIIVCLATMAINLRNEILKWRPNARIQIAKTGKDTIDLAADFFIVNFSLVFRPNLLKRILAREFDTLIVDESHKIKNPAAKCTQAVLGSGGISSTTKRNWLLTGTPVLNKPVDLFPCVAALCPERFQEYVGPVFIKKTKKWKQILSYENFGIQFGGGYTDNWGFHADGATSIQELKQRLAGFMLRRTKHDVWKQLPKEIIQTVVIPENEDFKAVKQYQEEYIASRPDGLPPEIEEMRALGILSRVRRLIATAKMTQCVDFIKNLLEETDKVVVYTYHRDVTAGIAGAVPSVVLDGGMSANERANAIKEFIDDSEVKVLVGQITVAGTGIDGLQTVCDTVVFVEWSWVPADIRQAIDRVSRIGMKGDVVNAYFLVAQNTIEEQMIDTLIRKVKVVDEITGDNEKGGTLCVGNVKKTGIMVDEMKKQIKKENKTMEQLIKELIENVKELVEVMKENSSGAKRAPRKDNKVSALALAPVSAPEALPISLRGFWPGNSTPLQQETKATAPVPPDATGGAMAPVTLPDYKALRDSLVQTFVAATAKVVNAEKIKEAVSANDGAFSEEEVKSALQKKFNSRMTEMIAGICGEGVKAKDIPDDKLVEVERVVKENFKL